MRQNDALRQPRTASAFRAKYYAAEKLYHFSHRRAVERLSRMHTALYVGSHKT
jgi:hypothetical protein